MMRSGSFVVVVSSRFATSHLVLRIYWLFEISSAFSSVNPEELGVVLGIACKALLIHSWSAPIERILSKE